MRRDVASIGSLVAGALLLASSLLVTGHAIELFCHGKVTGVLAWGPALFRMLLALHGLLLIGLGVWLRRAAPAPWESFGPGVLIERRPAMVLLALSVAGAALRFYKLGTQLWFDEIVTLVEFVRPPVAEILTTFPAQNQHLLFSLLAHGSISIFGETSWALRLPSVVFAIASIWALYLLARQLLETNAALLTSAFITFSYHHIWFSQNARGYTALLLFAILATWAWLEATRSGAWHWWAVYSAMLVLGCCFHLTMLFIPASHLIIHLIELAAGAGTVPGWRWKPIAAWCIAGTLTLQFFALVLPQILSEAVHEVSIKSEWTNPLWLVTETLRSLQIGFVGSAAMLFALVLPAISWIAVYKTNRRAAIGMTLPGLLCAITILALGHNLWPRFFFFLMGFAMVFAVKGAFEVAGLVVRLVPGIDDRGRAAGRVAYSVTALMVLASALTIPRLYALPKQDFLGAKQYVEERVAPGDRITTVGLANVAYGQYYAGDWPPSPTREALESMLGTRGEIWLVYTIPIQIRSFHPEIWELVERSFEPVATFPGTLGAGEVIVCRRR